MSEIKPKSKRGGYRPNAGRPPKGQSAKRAKSKRSPPRVVSQKALAAVKAAAPAETELTPPPEPSETGLRPGWKPGQSGNPAGRPKGARSKLGEAFLADFYADWIENGADAIRTVRLERPQDYLKAAVQILPKELNVEGNINHTHEERIAQRREAIDRRRQQFTPSQNAEHAADSASVH